MLSLQKHVQHSVKQETLVIWQYILAYCNVPIASPTIALPCCLSPTWQFSEQYWDLFSNPNQVHRAMHIFTLTKLKDQ